MSWLANTLWTPIGKKLLMGVTGLCFCGFLCIHLAGNLTLYSGGALFTAYADRLHQMGVLIVIAEWVLLALAIIHVLTGAILFYENLRARPIRYAVKKRAGGRTLGSTTMPYTGFILLSFVVYHLMNFHFVDKTDQTIYEIISVTFNQPGHVVFYILAMIVVAIHISHGFWSAFQTFGMDHVKYTPVVKCVSILFSIIIGFGFACIPIYMFIMI